MARATYAELGDACATAHAMELIGARWTYPIIRELMLGPKRFNALLVSVFGITPAVLTARLHEMAAAGLIAPAADDPRSYALTAWAHDLAPVLRELGRWAQSSPIRSDAGGLTPDAVVQAMITMAGDDVPDTPVRVHLMLSDLRVEQATECHYLLEWTDAGLTVERGPIPAAPATVRCDSSTWGRILFNGLAMNENGATIRGDPTVVSTLLSTFRRALAHVDHQGLAWPVQRTHELI